MNPNENLILGCQRPGAGAEALPPPMGVAVDLRACLDTWPYDPEDNVRLGRGSDGRQILLVRRPAGLDQYELDGRPDGRPVEGRATALAWHLERRDLAWLAQPGPACELRHEDCAALGEEANAYYDRLVALFRLRDWARVDRDASHILGLLDFLASGARCATGRRDFDAWRPPLARVRAAARALMLLNQGQHPEASQMASLALGGTVPVTVRLSNLAPAGIPALPSGTVPRDPGVPNPATLAAALIASARGLLAKRPVLPPGEESSLSRQHDYWIVRHYGHCAVLKATRGLDCLAGLLRSPGREFHVRELLGSLPEAPTPATQHAGGTGRRDGEDGLTVSGLNDGCPVLDAQAKAAYQRRLHELREEVAEAGDFNDPDRAARAQEELDALAQHLAAAVGLGGRDRKVSSDAERARSAVTKRIKEAIQKIGEAIPELGDHLSTEVKTGYFCSYKPHPERRVRWTF